MANQKEINVAKFEKLRWTLKDKEFRGETFITRKPFGSFKVTLSINTGGCTGVRIRNEAYGELFFAGTYANHKCAIESIGKYFERIDELALKLNKQAQAAEKERQRLIGEAIDDMFSKKQEERVKCLK